MPEPQSFQHLRELGESGQPSQARRRRRHHNLTREQKIAMFEAGFTPREVREADESISLDYNSLYFRRMVRSRRNWFEAMRLNNWTDQEIRRRLTRFMRIKNRTIWDFFRMEYAITSQRPTLTRSRFDAFLKIRREVSTALGRAYGRIQSVKRAHYLGLKGVPKPRRR